MGRARRGQGKEGAGLEGAEWDKDMVLMEGTRAEWDTKAGGGRIERRQDIGKE